MDRGVLIVETELTSPELADEFHRQYDEIHLGEMLAVDGFVSARRFEPVDGTGPFVAVYEIEAENLDDLPAKLGEVIGAGKLTTPTGVQTDPPPRVRFLRQISAAGGGSEQR